MAKPVVIVSDRQDRVRDIKSCLGPGFGTIPLDPTSADAPDTNGAVLMVVDVDLSEREMVETLKYDVLKRYKHLPSVFLTEDSSRLDIVQSHALGADKTVTRRQAIGRLRRIAEAYAQTAAVALAEAGDRAAPYFSIVIVHGQGRRP